jgi:hypothetical protein
MSCISADMFANPKFLQRGHLRQACLQSTLSPGQKKWSRSLSLMRSALMSPFRLCVLGASWNPVADGLHSVRATLSQGLVLTCQSVLFLMVKHLDRCIACLRSEIESPADFLSRWQTIGLKKMLPSKSSSRLCLGEPGESVMSMMSFLMPFDASQSGSMDQEEPSEGIHCLLRHILLRPSATRFWILEQWRISIML